jgi:Protein of unknown function (DUF1631)
MSGRPTLQAFIQHELRQAEPLFNAIAGAVLDAWREKLPTRLASDLDAPRVLLLHRSEFARRAAGALHDQVQRGRAPATAPPKPPGRLELALVEDDEVTTDIEIARVVERANATLEHEVRELRTFTSALVGDINTSRETNPLRPEAWVRALMVGARALPISRTMQTALLRAAADPLTRAIRDNYASACARLQAEGVQPASHRTIVNEGQKIELTDAMRARRGLERATGDMDLDGHPRAPPAATGSWSQRPATVHDLRRQVELGLPTTGPYASAATTAAVIVVRADVAGATQPEVAPAERLSKLFDTILADRRLPRECVPLLSRYYPAALRFAMSEPASVDDAANPLWRFVDQLAFLVQTRAVGDEGSNVAFARSLVDQLAANPALEARHFQSGIARISVHERQRFARAVAAAADDIAELGAYTQHAATGFGPSLPQALDVGRVEKPDTTQRRRTSDLTPEEPAATDQWKPGVWLNLFLRGQWRRALVLWRGPARGPLLMLDATEASHWAVRRQSLERLAAEGLARQLLPRSLLSHALSRPGQVFRESGSTLFG